MGGQSAPGSSSPPSSCERPTGTDRAADRRTGSHTCNILTCLACPPHLTGWRTRKRPKTGGRRRHHGGMVASCSSGGHPATTGTPPCQGTQPPHSATEGLPGLRKTLAGVTPFPSLSTCGRLMGAKCNQSSCAILKLAARRLVTQSWKPFEDSRQIGTGYTAHSDRTRHKLYN